MVAPPLDPIAAATHPDPYPYYARLAREDAIAYDARCDAWIAASAPAVEAVLGHPAALVRPPGEPVPPALSGSKAAEVFASFARFNDGARHERLRAAVEAAIAQLSMPADDPDASIADLPLDEYIERYAVYALAGAIGYPARRLPEIFTIVRDFARALVPGASAGDVCAADAAESLTGLALLFQSYDATRGAIGNTLVALARHPQYAGTAGDAPAGAAQVVEEVLRYDSPVQNTRRYFAEDTAVGGACIPAGKTVLAVLAAANRDERANPGPDRFDPLRRATRIFTFGTGPHACPGKTLAVTIAARAVRRLLARGLDVRELSVASYKPAPNVRIPLFGR